MRTIHKASTVEETAQGWARYDLRELVGHEVDDWDDEKLRQEAYKSAEIMLSESKHAHPELHALVRDRALTLLQDDMPRVPMDRLTSDDREKVVLDWRYWPFDMTDEECREILEQLSAVDMSDYWLQAESEAKRGLVDKLTDI